MSHYEVELGEGLDGISVTCETHGEREEYDATRRRVSFFCPGCETEVEIGVRDPNDWRAWDERD